MQSTIIPLPDIVVLIINNEQTYQHIKGPWKTNSKYVVFHRLVILHKYLKKGIAQKNALIY